MRSAMLAASQLPGRGPTDVDDAPAPARLLKNLIMMIMMYQVSFFFYLKLSKIIRQLK